MAIRRIKYLTINEKKYIISVVVIFHFSLMNLILLILTIAENIVIIVIKYQIIMWKGENFNNFIFI